MGFLVGVLMVFLVGVLSLNYILGGVTSALREPRSVASRFRAFLRPTGDRSDRACCFSHFRSGILLERDESEESDEESMLVMLYLSPIVVLVP